MTIRLKPEHEKVIAEAIESRAYENADDVISRASDALKDEEAWLRGQKSEIAEKIDRAFEQFERGEYFSAEESRAEMEKRKAGWRDEPRF